MKRFFSGKQDQRDTEMADERRDSTSGGLFLGLARTRDSLLGSLVSFFQGSSIDESAFEALEDQLLVADVGVLASEKILAHLRREVKQRRIQDPTALRQSLRSILTDMLAPCQVGPLTLLEDRPLVLLMVGVNGVGKTTTLAKVAAHFQGQGSKVMLAACDTFRAAAIEQLQTWGERLGVPVVAQKHGADAAAVAFDAYSSARARGMSLLLVDTAGRQHTHGDLVEQLKKIQRALGKADASIPDEVWMTVDAGNGQNVLSQVAHFHAAVHLTGICVTKLDGTAKGGVMLALADQFALPIRYVGIGEGTADLRAFHAADFAEALLPNPVN